MHANNAHKLEVLGIDFISQSLIKNFIDFSVHLKANSQH